MSRKKLISIALFVGAIVVLAGGAFSMYSGHMKTGIGLIVLGVILIASGLVALLSRSTSTAGQLDREWL